MCVRCTQDSVIFFYMKWKASYVLSFGKSTLDMEHKHSYPSFFQIYYSLILYIIYEPVNQIN